MTDELTDKLYNDLINSSTYPKLLRDMISKKYGKNTITYEECEAEANERYLYDTPNKRSIFLKGALWGAGI